MFPTVVAQQNLLRNLFPHLRMLLLLLLCHLNLLRLAGADGFGRSLQHRSDDTFKPILKVYDFVRILQFCARFRFDTRRHFGGRDRR